MRYRLKTLHSDLGERHGHPVDQSRTPLVDGDMQFVRKANIAKMVRVIDGAPKAQPKLN